MRDARERADAEVSHAIETIEVEIASILGEDVLLGAPDLGGKFRGYRVGEGSAFTPLPPRMPKLAIDARGLLVVATLFGDIHHVQRAPHSMRQARILESYMTSMTTAMERHAAAATDRAAKFDGIRERAERVLAAMRA